MMIIIIIPAAQIYIPSKTDQEPSDSITKKNEERRTPIYYYQQDKKDSKTIPNEKKSSTTDDKKAKFNRDERRDHPSEPKDTSSNTQQAAKTNPDNKNLGGPVFRQTNDISHNNAKSENQNSFDPEFDSGWRTYIVLDSTLLLLTMERIHARIHPAQEQLKSKLTGEEKKMYPSEERSPASL